MSIPASWVIVLFGVGSVILYILYLQWRARRIARKAADAFRERDNALVRQHTAEVAQKAEHAYHQAQQPAKKTKVKKTLLEQLNDTAPMVLLLLMLGGCASEPKLVEVNPAKQVVIPPMQPLEHYQWQDVLGYHCLDDEAARAYLRNTTKINTRIDGLEAALRALGATVE